MSGELLAPPGYRAGPGPIDHEMQQHLTSFVQVELLRGCRGARRQFCIPTKLFFQNCDSDVVIYFCNSYSFHSLLSLVCKVHNQVLELLRFREGVIAVYGNVRMVTTSHPITLPTKECQYQQPRESYSTLLTLTRFCCARLEIACD